MPDVWEQISHLLHFSELGDMPPSQLMDEMLAMLPQEEQPGLLFKHNCLERLPDDCGNMCKEALGSRCAASWQWLLM